MRDWIGTGVSLLGFIAVVIGFVQLVRTRTHRSPSSADRSPAGRRSRSNSAVGAGPAEPTETRETKARRTLSTLIAGLTVMEIGQLIRAHGWPWAILHLTVIGLLVAGSSLLYRDRRKARRES